MTTRRSHSRRQTDEGLTFVELLVTVGLVGLVAAVISAAVIVVFRNDAEVVRRTAESHDTQQGVNYFPLDVHAGPVEVGGYVTTAANGCSPVGTNVLQFEKGGVLVAYRLSPTGSTYRLDRQICDAGTLAGLVTRNIADQLDGPAAVNIVASGGLVESIELTLAQDGTDALVVASPRPEPLNSPGDCATDNPIEAAHGFGVFIEGDVELQDGEVTGWLGLGGTLTWLSAVDVATGNMSGVDPAYGLFAESINWGAAVKTVDDLDVTVAGVATATVVDHGYLINDQVVIDGTGDADIDRLMFTITNVIGSDTFEFAANGPANNLSGTVIAVDPARIVAITDLDVASGTATATATGHGYRDGQLVVIQGTGNVDIDGESVVVSVSNVNKFTFPVPVTTAPVTGLVGSAVTGLALGVGDEDVAIGDAFLHSGDFVYESSPNPLAHHIRIDGSPSLVDDTASQIGFADDFDELRDCSAGLARLIDLCEIDGCANEVDVTVDWVNKEINACSDSPVPQVLNVPEEFFDGSWEFTTSGSGCQGFSQTRPLVLNVIETVDDPATAANEDDGDSLVTINAAPGDWTALGDRKNILFNFPNADAVIINNGFYGQVLAPFAHVTTNGFVEGGVIATQWTHVDGVVDSNDDLFNNPISWP